MGIIKVSSTPEVNINLNDLKRHLAALGGTGSGKTTAVLNIIEQALQQGIPVIMVDRKGDLCGYAGVTAVPAALRERWEAFQDKVETVVYTPGHTAGRPINIPLAPTGLYEMEETDRKNATNAAGHALGDMLNYKHTGKDAAARAIIFTALDLMVMSNKEISIKALIDYLRRPSPKFLEAIAMLDLGVVGKVIMDLGVFALDKGRVLTSKGEALNLDELLGKGKGGKTRLTIISTKFLGHASLFWVAQLLIEAARWSSKNPSPNLQALLFLDEADAYIPARSNPATKQPLEDLLKRGRSAGLGCILATQSPGDMDYKARDNVWGWLMGRIREEVALKKIRPVVQDDAMMDRISAQTVGQFVFATEGSIKPLLSNQSMMVTKQLPEDRILALAKRGRISNSERAQALKEERAVEAAQGS
jgi:hypothetical protein